MQFGTVTGRFLAAVADRPTDPDVNPDLVPVSGTVRFTPSASSLVSTADSAIVLPAPIVAEFDNEGYLSLNGVRGVSLVATDSTGINPVGFTYTVTFSDLKFDKIPLTYKSFSMSLPANTTVDLSTVTPVGSSNGVTIIRGEKGESGPAGGTFTYESASGMYVAPQAAPIPSVNNATNLLPSSVMAALDTHNDYRYAKAVSWVDARLSTMDVPPPPIDTPTITWSNSDATALSSPAIFRPAACGTGAQVTGWDGASDPVFRYEPGTFMTDAGGTKDYALYGEYKPGGDAQFARWPLVISFVTQAANSVVEIAFYSRETNNGIRVEVNGRFLSDLMNYTTAPSNSGKVTLTFPSAAARTIRVWAFGTLGFAQFRIPTGQTLTKPPAPKCLVALLGDSYLNGAGSSYPNMGTIDQTTFGVRLARYIGGDSFMLAGIGSTGIEAGSNASPPRNYAARAAVIRGRAPKVLFINASINDGGNAGTLEASTAALLAQFTSVPEVYVVGGIRKGYEANYAAVRAATLAAGRVYLDLNTPMFGTGKISDPHRDGTNDFWLLEDGAHPSLDAHIALARIMFKAYALAKLSNS